MELASNGGLTREVGALQQVVQTGDLLSEPKPMPGRPEPAEPMDDLLVDLDSTKRLVLAWQPVAGATRYALQVSRYHLFVDNVIDAENRTKTRATLGVRGEGTFQWRVAAFGQNGLQGPWSEARKFRVAAAVRNPAALAAVPARRAAMRIRRRLTSTRSKPTVVSSWSAGTASRGRGWRSMASRSRPTRTARSPRPSS